MICVVLMMSLLASAAAINCTACGEVDYGDFDYAAYNLTTSIDDATPECDSPATVTCDEDTMMCGNATLELTMAGEADGVAFALPITVTLQSCVAAAETCDTLSASTLLVIEADEDAAAYEWEVATCTGERCDGDGAECVDLNGATTMSLVFVSIISAISLL